MKTYNLTRIPLTEPETSLTNRNFQIDYRSELNDQQFKAATHLQGPQLVIAGAGSGKTRTLVYRVAYLVESGIPPESILLLTFTRKSAQEMMRRASGILDERCLRVQGGTFHSYANRILRKFSHKIGYQPSFTIIDQSDAGEVINFIRTEHGFTLKNKRFPQKKTILKIISKARNSYRSFSEIVAQEFPQFWNETDDMLEIARLYEEYKRLKSLMDYDDLLFNLKTLLVQEEEIRKYLSQTSRFIMLDEYQDTNMVQAEIAALIATEYHNIMAVGDDSQSIYSFRGANFKNIMDFPQLFPNCEIITLEENYRSTQPILTLTNSILKNAEEKYSKHLFTQKKGDQKPIYIVATNRQSQAAFVCERVLDLIDEGISLGEIAVLFRSGWHSNELEVELGKYNIPFVKHGGLKFIEAAHIKDVISYLRIIFNPNDSVSWHRILRLIEGIGTQTAIKIAREIVDMGKGYSGLLDKPFQKKKYSEALQNLHTILLKASGKALPPVILLESIMQYYTPLFLDTYSADASKRRNDLESLLNIASHYQSLEKFLTEMFLDPPEFSQVEVEQESDQGTLTLSTIHSAKGLEWHSVFLISLVDGYLPSSYSIESQDGIEEERRLFYVAATRAKKGLYLLRPEKLGRSSFNLYRNHGSEFLEPSRFLSEINDWKELTEQWKLNTL